MSGVARAMKWKTMQKLREARQKQRVEKQRKSKAGAKIGNAKQEQ